MNNTHSDHTNSSIDALDSKTGCRTKTNYETKRRRKDISSQQTDSSTVDGASILIDIHSSDVFSKVLVGKDICDEIIKLLAFVSGMNVNSQTLETMYDNYHSYVVNDFFSMSGLFKRLVDKGFAKKEDNLPCKLIIGKIFLSSCNKNDYIILDDDTKTKVIGSFKHSNMKVIPFSKSTINRKNKALFLGISKIQQITKEIKNSVKEKGSSMSTRQLHSMIWDNAKKRSLNWNRKEFWCPEGFLTYVLFIDPATRVMNGTKFYDNFNFRVIDDKPSSNLQNEITNDFGSNYESNEVKSQMKIDYYSQHIQILQNNINSIMANREFEFYYERYLGRGGDFEPNTTSNNLVRTKQHIDKFNVTLKRKFTDFDKLYEKYKSFEKWFDDTEPK